MRILLCGFDCVGTSSLHEQGHTLAAVDLFHELPESSENVSLPYQLFPDVETASLEFQPELAIIGVPNFMKNTIVSECYFMEHKIPLLISKLRLRNLEDFDVLVNCATENDAKVWIGEFYRMHPRTYTMRCLIEEGFLGDIEQVTLHCFIDDSTVYPWEKAYRNLALEDLAFHHLSTLQELVGLDGEVNYAYSRSPKKAHPSSGTVSGVTIKLLSGAYIEHTIHWHNTAKRTDYFGDITIDGTVGGILLAGNDITCRRWGEKAENIPLLTPPYRYPINWLIDFLQGITLLEPRTFLNFLR